MSITNIMLTGTLQGPAGGGKPSIVVDNFDSLSSAWLKGDLSAVDNAAVSGGALTITPAASANLYDPGKGTFDSGTETWGAYGTNAKANDGGQLRLTYVDNEQMGYGYLDNTNGDMAENDTVGDWYRFVGQFRVNGGAVTLRLRDGTGNSLLLPISDTSLATKIITYKSGHANNIIASFQEGGAGEIVWLDNLAKYHLATADLSLIRPLNYPVSRVGVKITRATGVQAQAGVGLYKDADNYIRAWITGYASTLAVELGKCVGGTYSTVKRVGFVEVAGAELEIVPNETFDEFSVYYNDSAIIANQSITDHAETGIWYAEIFSSDPSTSFDDFRARKVYPFDAGTRFFAVCGDSKSLQHITWPQLLEASLRITIGSTWRCADNFAVAGETLAVGLTHLSADLAGAVTVPEAILINYGANDVDALPAEATWMANLASYLEALHAKWPNAQLYVMRPWKRGENADCDALATWIAAVVASYAYANVGPDERDFLEAGNDGVTYTVDGTHPNAAGYQLTAQQWQTVMGF